MNDAQPSEAFDILHLQMQRWIWRQGWESLRSTQERAIPSICRGDCDVIIAAATAGGKTEAAFLPVLSQLLQHYEDNDQYGLSIYIAPLKALINDQVQRLEMMAENSGINVVPWHGDINQNKKYKFLKDPSGVLLITPESLESIFVNHGQRIPLLFNRLQYLIIDELHSFMGVERGMQLQSLVHRIELAIRRRVPRIGLSATLGDMKLAAGFLRPNDAESVETIISTEDSGSLKLQVRGYEHKPPKLSSKQIDSLSQAGKDISTEDSTQGDVLDIARHLFEHLRGTNNLIFANSRSNVETYADLLRRECEHLNVPIEFFPHHGSLSRDLRQYVEKELKNTSRPISAVCTSTMEMGVDIGSVASIAQIGPPHQVSGMRQRLGRSGRRGEAAVLRIYIQEEEIDDKTPVPDRIRPALFQAVAMAELLLSRWTEPPRVGALHFSTMIQQILSVVAQYGGATAKSLWNILCKNAPFASIERDDFVTLLKQMGETTLLTQSTDGTLLPGEAGERIVNHYSFYTAFTTPEEYSLGVEGRIIGTLPIDYPIAEGSYIIFGGKRWKVLQVDTQNKRIDLTPAGGGRAPSFGGTPGILHDIVRSEMFDLYNGTKTPQYLDKQAKHFMDEGRDSFRELKLDESSYIQDGDDTLVFLWAGDVVMDTVSALLRHEGIKSTREGLCLSAKNIDPRTLSEKFNKILLNTEYSTYELAAQIKNKATEKYDLYLSEYLLNKNWASKRLDVNSALQAIKQLKSS